MSLRPLPISLGYALLSAVWIVFSDQAVLYMAGDSPETMARLSMIKGWLFIALTALLLWGVLSRARGETERQAGALQASEERYRLVVETASEGIEGVDENMRVVFANAARAQMLGYTPEEMIGHRVDDFLFHEDLADHKHHMQRRILGISERYERRLRHKNGSEVWAIVSVAPWMSPAGRFLGSFATFTDISQRKSMESALRRSREFLDNVVDNIPDPIFVKDDAHRFLLVNQALCAMTGRTRDEMLGHTDLDFFPEEQARGFIEKDRLVMETGATDTTEEIVTSSSGDHFTVITRKNRYLDEQGRKHVVGIIRDVTERNRAVMALRQSEETFRKLFDNSSDAILLMTREGRFTACNQACLPMLGISDKSELIGKTPLDVSPQRQPSGVLSADAAKKGIEQAFATGVCRLEWLCTRIDGSPLLLDITLVPVTIDGEPLMHLTGRDVTETKRMQEIMIQTEKMMSVGGLAAGMAHEINNPLSGILQSVQVIRRRLGADNRRNAQAARDSGCSPEMLARYVADLQIPEFLESIHDAGERASAIVANMLEFSRRNQKDRQPADINALVEKTVALCGNDFDLRKKYDIKKIAIACDLADNLPLTPVIASELSQVVFNLVKNAVQALAGRSPETGPAIWLRTRLGIGFVTLEVEDNGPGVDPEHARRVFEPFFTTKGPGEGTGLGLSVSYYIVTTHHGGGMRVEPRPGGGARFVIELPL